MPAEKEFKSNDPVDTFEAKPPKWRAAIHQTASLGWPDFIPGHPERLENVMSDANIKSGLAIPPFAKNESSTAQVTALEKLEADDAVSRLGDLMSEILSRREAAIGGAGPSTFKAPSRVTMIEARRMGWLADLANPDVPLHQLSARVPHGPKGSDLFELLFSKDVPISRAVWFVRTSGANETAAMRSKANYNPAMYSYETAKEVINYFKKQLGEITLPSVIRQVTGVKQTFKGVLLDPETRESWSARFVYTIQLVREFYAESMIDHGTFLHWIAQQIAALNLAQLGMFIRVVDEYLDDICAHRAFCKPLVEGCLAKLQEIETSPGQTYLSDLRASLRRFVQIAVLDVPDAFISPRIWSLHADVLLDVINAYVPTKPDTSNALKEHTLRALRRTYQTIQNRNRALLFDELQTTPMTYPRKAIQAIQNLNSLTSKSHISTFEFFDQQTISSFQDKVDLLMTWAVSKSQYGCHRSHAVASILSKWRDDAQLTAIRRKSLNKPGRLLQTHLFQWLHSYSAAQQESDLPAIANLYGELVRRNVFSYAKYVQELIARGELEPSSNDPSHHLAFLRAIPLVVRSEDLESQRRAALYGIEAEETPEDRTMLQMRKEVKALLPEFFSREIAVVKPTLRVDSASVLLGASLYEQVRLIHHGLLPMIKKHVAKRESAYPDAPAMSVDSYIVLMQLLTNIKLYTAVLEMNLFLLYVAKTKELHLAVVNTFRRHALIWTCMDVTGVIVEALLAKQQAFKLLEFQVRPLLALIMEFDAGRYLTKQSRENVQRDIDSVASELTTSTLDFAPLPAKIPEVLDLALNSTSVSPDDLAATLWSRHKFVPEWPTVVWQNVVDSLSQMSRERMTPSDWIASISRLTIFVSEVDQHLVNGFDEHLRIWCGRPEGNKLLQMDDAQWDMLASLLINLCVTNAVSCPTILQAIVFPAWKSILAHTASTDPRASRNHAACLWHTARLFERLLLLTDVPESDVKLSPLTLEQIDRLQTQRLEMYRKDYWEGVLQSVLYLMALETSPYFDADIKSRFAQLRMSLFKDQLFKHNVFRDVLFAQRTLSGAPELRTFQIEHRVEDALKDLMRVDDDSDDVAGRLDQPLDKYWERVVHAVDPWRCHRVAVTVQLIFNKLCREAQDPKGNGGSSAERLATASRGLFERSWSSEELDFIAELLNGIDLDSTVRLLVKGLRRVTEDLRSTAIELTGNGNSGFADSAGDTLKLMLKMTTPVQAVGSTRPTVPEAIPDDYMEALSDAWHAIHSTIARYRTIDSFEARDFDPDVVRQTVVVSARVLHFILGILDIWSPKCKQLAEDVISSSLRLATVYGSDGPLRDPVLFSVLLDTACYLIDDLPPNPRNPNADFIRVIPGVAPNNLPPDMCDSHRRRMRLILHYVPQDFYVANLQHAPSAKGPGARVQNRPWEWAENLESRSATDTPNVEEYTVFPPPDQPLSNNASISLELFQAKGTRDRVAAPSVAAASSADEAAENRRIVEERAAGDALGGETSFERDWRAGNVPLRGARVTVEEEDEDDADDDEWPRLEEIQGTIAPVEAPVAGPSKLQQTDDGDLEIISQSGKRMATEVIDIASSDEDEVVEVAPPRGRGRKGKSRAVGRSRAAKRR